jgi:hypothetical protein
VTFVLFHLTRHVAEVEVIGSPERKGAVAAQVGIISLECRWMKIANETKTLLRKGIPINTRQLTP